MKYRDKATGAVLEPAVAWVDEMYAKNPDFVPLVEKKPASKSKSPKED